ncbi:MAG: hypothetical protein LQ351_004007 [Letrouitia transgressa]|nr:MAG: hypothetical protein LQ351_004007 [Letrouitia transgressa]
MESSGGKQATTRNQLPSRPSTPLRPSSRTSLRDSQALTSGGHPSSSAFPLAFLETAFAELSDSMADLEANMMHLQLMHESLSRFNENFASFLYGLNMNAFCVDFPEAPIPESFKRAALNDESGGKKLILSSISRFSTSTSTTAPEESDKTRAEQESEATFLLPTNHLLNLLTRPRRRGSPLAPANAEEEPLEERAATDGPPDQAV